MADHNPTANDNNIAANGIQINARDRLFHAIFIKAAAVYIRVVPKWCRALLEVLVLAKALVLFTTLSYIHFTFSKNPMDCLENFKDTWPRDGILQVQILKNQVKAIYKQEPSLPPYFATKWNRSLVTNETVEESNQCSLLDQEYEERKLNISRSEMFEADPVFIDSVIDDEYLPKRETVFYNRMPTVTKTRYQQQPMYFPTMQQLIHFYANKQVKNFYIMEYALEYGFLRLSQETRRKLSIPVKVVTLDPKTDKCFGDSLSRFILDKLLGYDDLLMASIKKLAEKEGNRGYMKNVLSGEHYKFVTSWMGRTSYVVSFLLMFVFTISISTLLRFCHQQIFIFIVHLLHVMDWNATLTFPVAPMFTVILSLVGMEAIMAEFFNDTTTSFYVILIVWAADQFDSICCHTRLSQKYWLRFFYLYHFLFYAYHYRFNGQYSTIALAASWFFIQHSMLYFLHNYEIPAIEAALNAQGGNYLDDAVDLLVDEMQLPQMPENATVQPNANEMPQHNIEESTEQSHEGTILPIVTEVETHQGMPVNHAESEGVVLSEQEVEDFDQLLTENAYVEVRSAAMNNAYDLGQLSFIPEDCVDPNGDQQQVIHGTGYEYKHGVPNEFDLLDSNEIALANDARNGNGVTDSSKHDAESLKISETNFMPASMEKSKSEPATFESSTHSLLNCARGCVRSNTCGNSSFNATGECERQPLEANWQSLTREDTVRNERTSLFDLHSDSG